MRSVGIDIGSYSVKVCVVNSTKKGLYLEQFSEKVLLSANPFDRNLEIIEFLRSEIANLDPSQIRFVASIPQDLVSVHTKIFPFKDRLKIIKSLPFELEEDTPFNPDETVFDGRTIRVEATQSEVLACACPKETVKQYVQLMSDSGVTLSLLTPEGLAFANHFEKWSEPVPVVPFIDDPSIPSEIPRPPRTCQALLNMGHTHTTLLVLEDGKIVDVRSLSWGGDSIARTIQEKYNISYAEALKQLQANAFILTSNEGADADQIFFSNLIAGSVNELIRELRLVFLEIQASANVTILGCKMTGGTSRIQNLAPYLTQNLELPVNKYSVLDQFPNTNFEKTPKIDAIIASSIGLAIEGLRKPRNPAVSFLRGEFAIQSHAFQNFVDTWATTLKFASMLVIMLYVYASVRESAALTMAEQADQVMKEQAQTIAKLKGSKATEQGIEKFISQKRKTIKELKDLESFVAMNSALEILKKVNDAAPGRSTLRMEVRQFSVKDGKVRLEGYVATLKDTKILQDTLVSLATDRKINPVQASFAVPAGKIPFGFEFTVDRNVKVSKGAEKAGRSKL